MPTRITRFIHPSVNADLVAIATTAFTTDSVQAHDLTSYLPAFQKESANFKGIVNGLHVKLSDAAAATEVTIRICADADGDEVLVPDTTATLVAGITTSTVKWAAFKIDLPLYQFMPGPGLGTLYVFAYADGAADFEASLITWQE